MQRYFSCCPLFIMLFNGLKISHYEKYPLTDFLLINNYVHVKRTKVAILSFEMLCTNRNFEVNRDHSFKKVKEIKK